MRPSSLRFRFRFPAPSLFAAATLGAVALPLRAGVDEAVKLDPFVVSGSLDQAREDIVPSLGATSYQIDARQIDTEALGANASFNQVLLRSPAMAEDSFGQVHLRGEHADLQYRINDVVLPEGIAGFGQELDVPFIKSVNIVTGSLPAQYGYRTAGVIDIHTLTGGAMAGQGDLSVFAGSHNTLRTSVEAGGASGSLTAFVTASAQTDTLGIENPTPDREALHDRTDQVKVFADLSYILAEGSRLTLLLGSSSAAFQIPDNPGQTPVFAVGPVTAFDSGALNENQAEDNDYAILAYQFTHDTFSAQLSAFTRYSLTHFMPDWTGDLVFNGTASDVHQDLISNGVEADSRWAAAPNHTLRTGFLILSTNANTETTTGVFPTDGAGNLLGSEPDFIPDNHHKLGWLYGAYAQDEWRPLTALTVNFGARADGSRGYLQEGQISPRVNVVWQATDATSLHAGYARYFTPPPLELEQTPTLSKFVGTTNEPTVLQNDPIRSERADYFDAGLTQKIGSDLSLTVDGYYKRATHQLDEGQFGAALIFASFNYARGRIYGAEASANYAHGGFSAYANVATGRALGETISSGQFQFGPDALAYAANHWIHLDHDQLLTASAGVSYAVGKVMVLADCLYGSGLRSGFVNQDHVPEHHPVNVGVQRRFPLAGGRALTLRADVENVFDESYELRDGSGIGVFAPQYGPRRGCFATATYNF